MKTIRQIIIEYIQANGYDGLAGDECGCSIEHLAPCDNPLECVPAYKHVCDCGDGCLWHMKTEKPEAKP